MSDAKYIRKSHHLPRHLYQAPGAYFVTICTYQRKQTLSIAQWPGIQLTALGRLAFARWEAMPQHHPPVQLDSFVVMPNHLHGIIWISHEVAADTTATATSLQVLINSYKSSVTRLARQRGLWGSAPLWQPGYWDHVIRDEDDLARVREYIQQNPLTWQLDRENADRIGLNEIYRWMESFQERPAGGPPTKS